MTHEIMIYLRKGEKRALVLEELRTSASFFGQRGIEFQVYKDGIGFVLPGNASSEYLDFLSKKFDASFEYVETSGINQRN